MANSNELEDLRKECANCRSCIQRAFVKNDLGEPDYDGHRKAHATMIEADKVMEGFKREAAKKIVAWAMTVTLAVLSSALVLWWKDQIK